MMLRARSKVPAAVRPPPSQLQRRWDTLLSRSTGQSSGIGRAYFSKLLEVVFDLTLIALIASFSAAFLPRSERRHQILREMGEFEIPPFVDSLLGTCPRILVTRPCTVWVPAVHGGMDLLKSPLEDLSASLLCVLQK